MTNANHTVPSTPSGWRSLKFSRCARFARFALRMWAAKPRQRRNIRWPNTPSHLGKRMMLDSSTAWHGQEAGTGHQHPQSCVAIPVTDPVVVQGTSRCVIVGRGHDRGQLSFTASDLLAIRSSCKEQLIQPVIDAQCQSQCLSTPSCSTPTSHPPSSMWE